ncbi:MAG: FolC bifunctional protein [Chthoniobacter sp.]|nr:FolC bifunctional protein [Chthoniobacter sp.]
MNYEESAAWLYTTQLHGIRLGLENIQRLLIALEVETSSSARCRFLHVAGTNGKGSVCSMLDAACRAAGFRTGLFTSPHLVTFRERLRVNGEMISETEVARGLSEIRTHSEQWEFAPTFFEITTALALRHFQNTGCNVVVLETGMGGRLDATNAVTPSVCVLTPIALDHQQWLGATIEEIAAEKAGIFKPGVPVVSAPQSEAVLRVLQERADAVGAQRLITIDQPWTGSGVNLPGTHQLWNAALAARGLAESGLNIPPEAVAAGFEGVQWPGRFQRLTDRLVLDGAHNPAAAKRLAMTWREEFPETQATVIVGILGDKDVSGISRELLPIAGRFIVVPVQNPRTSAPRDVCASLVAAGAQVPISAESSLASALRIAEQSAEPVLITGSLFLVGEALAAFQSTDAEVSAQ